jgi:hypothetical protein
MPKPIQIIDKFNLDEPSTYSAAAAGLVAIGVSIPEPIIMTVSLVLAGICSAFGIFKKEKGKKK